MYKLFRISQYVLIGAIVCLLVAPRLQAPVAMATPAAPADIGDYVIQVSEANLTATVTALVGYGPRLVNEHYVYVDDACTYGTEYFAENNLDRAANYAKGVLDAMGYTAVLETVPGYGHNVVAFKTGTVYPNTYIEFGAHLDTKPGTPGGNDNASGSAAVIEIARILKDYPSRYSMTFGLWVGEETGGFAGAYHHIDAMLAAGKQIKAGLNMDNMGQLGEGGIYRNDIWTNNAASLDIYDIFTQVNTQYGLGLTLVNNANPCCSDERAYWGRGLTAVTSVGGWWPSAPHYHGCGDVVANFNPTQGAKVTKQNLAAALNLDLDLVPPTVTLALSRTSMPADGSSTATATATVTDGNGIPLLTETVTFTTSGDISISNPVINHGDGTYSVTLTASTTTGPEAITATDSGVSATAIINETTYCPGTCFTDTTVTDYTGGIPGTGTYLSEMIDGEVILAPTVGSEFSGITLPTGWASAAHGTGPGTVTLQNGWITVDGMQVYTSDPTRYTPGRAIEFVATFGGGQSQAAGFAENATTQPWAVFDYDLAGTTLTAYSSPYAAVTIPGTWNGTPHRYRIEWTSSNIIYTIDGVQVASTGGISGNMRPIITDQNVGAQVNRIDWMRMSPYASTGTFDSRIFDGGSAVSWGTVTWSAETPAGTGVAISVRGGDTPAPDGFWGSFAPVTNGGSIGVSARYLQYRAMLSTTDVNLTPALNEISLRYTPGEVGPATKLGFLIQPGGAIAGNPFTTQPVVAVQDASGYTVTTDNTTQVTLAIGTNPSGGTLTCTTNPVTVVNGLANFAGCRLSNAGTGYTLTASGGSLTSATSASFNVAQVAPASISLALSPDTIAANGTATALATATVRDSGNNPLPGETVIFSTSGDVTFGLVTDNSDGTYSVTITASTSPGDETITATVGSLSANAALHETANCPGTCYFDTTASDFLSGTPGTTSYVAETENGEVILVPTVGAEFYGTALPSGWTVLSYGGSSPSVSVSGGKVSVGTARLRADGLYAPGHVLEYIATYTGGLYQAGGLGYSFDGSDGYVWATFDTAGVGTALNTNTNGTVTSITGSWLNAPHHYRIEWTTSGVVYIIDGIQRDSKLVTFARDMRPIFADNIADANFLRVDWVRMSPYASTGTFLSRVFDGGGITDWGVASWTAETPAGTAILLSVRSGNTTNPDDGTWTGFAPMTNGSSINANARYVQYQAVLSTSNADATPVLKDICLSYSDNTPPTIVNRSPAPGATNVAVGTNVTVEFSEAMLPSSINTSSFRLRAAGAPSDVPAIVTYAGITATLTPNAALAPATQYQVTVEGSVSDVNGNQMGSDVIWSFSTGGGTLTDDTVADFTAGTPGSDTYIALTLDGEVILKPTVGAEFDGSTLPTGWDWAYHNSTDGTYSVSNGWVTLDGVKVFSTALFDPGRTIEIVATLGGSQYQAIGFADSGTSAPWAVFDFASTNNLVAWNSTTGSIPILGNWVGSTHHYRIDWTTTGLNYYIDGSLQTPQSVTGLSNMRAFLGDYNKGSSADMLRVDWVRMSPYAALGTFTSRVFDAGQTVRWSDLSHTAIIPTGGALTFETQTSQNGSDWSTWQAVNSPIASPDGRYFRYRARFATSDTSTTPTLEDVTITYTNAPTAVTVSSFTGSSHMGTAQLDWETANEMGLVGFNLYRSETPGSLKHKLNANMISAEYPNTMQGASYQFSDVVDQGRRYYYWLELVTSHGTELLDPVVVDTDYLVRLPLMIR